MNFKDFQEMVLASPLTNRTKNCLIRGATSYNPTPFFNSKLQSIENWYSFYEIKEHELLKIKGIGRKTLCEIQKFLSTNFPKRIKKVICNECLGRGYTHEILPRRKRK